MESKIFEAFRLVRYSKWCVEGALAADQPWEGAAPTGDPAPVIEAAQAGTPVLEAAGDMGDLAKITAPLATPTILGRRTDRSRPETDTMTTSDLTGHRLGIARHQIARGLAMRIQD